MTDLPPGWERTRLDEIAEVRLGRQRSPKNHSGSHMRPYLRAANVDWSGLKLDDVKQMNFTDEEAETYRLRPGDIVLGEASGSPGEVGKPALWNGEIEDCCFQNTLIRVRSFGPDPKYLLHLLRHEALRGAFIEHSRGVGIHHIGAARLSAWPVSLPPLAEQRRIVAALEDHLSRLDAASVLLSQALSRARSLRKRLLVELTDPAESNEWKLCFLKDIVTRIRNGMFVSRPGTEPNGVPILRIGAVRTLRLDLTDIRYSAKDIAAVEAEGFLLREGDLLFTRYNGNPEYVGACAVVPPGVGPLTYPDKLIRVSVDRSMAIPEFVAMACSAGHARHAIRSSVKTTAGQAGISGRELKAVPMALPDIQEQRRRVHIFKEQEDVVQRLEAALETAVKRGRTLRRALLAETFSGRLAAQDPADEPVSELLARIRAERAAVPKQRRARRPASRTGSRTSKAVPAQQQTLL